jgi:hypothetical protein
MIVTGENRRTRIKTCPSATLSTKNTTWIDPGANPGLRGERPATNRLSHGMAGTNDWQNINCVSLELERGGSRGMGCGTCRVTDHYSDPWTSRVHACRLKQSEERSRT